MTEFQASESPPQAGASTADWTVQAVIDAAVKDPNLFANLAVDAGPVFAAAGLPLQPQQFVGFNVFFWEQLRPALSATPDGLVIQDDVEGWSCTLCKIGAYSIAAVIVAVGAAALTYLTAASAPVVALAAFAGVSAPTALAFIVGLGAAVTEGVSAVASEICQWTEACAADAGTASAAAR